MTGHKKPQLNKRERVQVLFTKPTLTKQYFKDECNINHIVNKFQQTGQILSQNSMDPQYGESPTIDLKTALDMVQSLHNEFDSLSDAEKEEFNNNPREYAQFLSNYAEAPESFIQTESGKTVTTAQETTQEPKNGSSDAEK